jgi:hypothetical protein
MTARIVYQVSGVVFLAGIVGLIAGWDLGLPLLIGGAAGWLLAQMGARLALWRAERAGLTETDLLYNLWRD